MAYILEQLGAAITGGTPLTTIAVESLTSTDGVLADSPSIGVGYGTGAGGAVSQATSKSTGVTLNNVCGTITMHNAALAAGAEVAFTVSNSRVAATDIPVVCIKSGATSGAYSLGVTAVAAGSFELTLTNLTDGSLSEAVVISFGLLKIVAA